MKERKLRCRGYNAKKKPIEIKGKVFRGARIRFLQTLEKYMIDSVGIKIERFLTVIQLNFAPWDLGR